MVVSMDGVGTILVMQDFTVLAGVSLGVGTDGTTGVMADLDLVGTTGDMDGTDLSTVIILVMHMVTVMATDITVVTIDSLIEVMH